MTSTEFHTVPFTPTEEQWGGLARAIVMWLDMEPKTPNTLFKHLKRSGEDIPDWLLEEPDMKNLHKVPPKGTRAAIIYKAMLMDYEKSKLKGNTLDDYSYCNKCGYAGEANDTGIHNTPRGDECHYLAGKQIPITTLTPVSKMIFIGNTVTLVTILGRMDPNELIKNLQRRMSFDLVIEVLQTAIETGKITLDQDGYVIAVNSVES